jgi:D-alanine--D-alanine ligase
LWIFGSVVLSFLPVYFMNSPRKLRVAVLCGGPSPERGISLNSARSACDHLEGDDVEVVPIYFDSNTSAYNISRAQLYSNTPSDFDFKLKQISKPLEDRQLRALLKDVDIAFPVMHGRFGEDGGIQDILENLGVPHVGSLAAGCQRCFDKYLANELIRSRGFYAPRSLLVTRQMVDRRGSIQRFLASEKIRRAIVKPANGGSSIGVYSVSSAAEASDRCELLLEQGYERIVVERFCEGTEFTVVLLQNRFGQPVSLLPVEIETDYSGSQIFDYRKKYLPTRQSSYHCPARFPDHIVERIQIEAEQIFSLFGMRDFVRFDGWYLKNGEVWFSDFNPVSGMEQNSFLFLQAARIGMTHRDTLRFILHNACARYGIPFAPLPPASPKPVRKKRVNVLFGGATAERQVSVMSGTNVWLKLMRSERYDPRPYLLDLKGRVWELPYSMTLNHTVEEITYVCERAVADEPRNKTHRQRVVAKLAPLPGQLSTQQFVPGRLSLQQFINKSPFAFLALHGGIGEDGTLQRALDRRKVKYNGSGAAGSRRCMDKFETGRLVESLKSFGIYSAPKQLHSLRELRKRSPRSVWREILEGIGGESFIVKPVGDGCSAGVARLYSDKDLTRYLGCLKRNLQRIPAGTLSNQHDIVEMPLSQPEALLFERFIETDRVQVVANELKWEHRTGWIEITVGVIGREGDMHAMNPSITVASGDVLTVEEKFQGGTGVNITPPPVEFIPEKVVAEAKRRIEMVAQVLGIGGYARIDAFLKISTGELIIIEANSLPGLTPSTVIFHQALEEQPKMYPREFLERVIGQTGY